MDTKHYRTCLSKICKQRNWTLVFALGLLLLCMFQTALLSSVWKRERIFLVPANLSSKTWVSASSFDAQYIANMATSFCLERLTFQPYTIKHQKALLLQWVAPAAYHAFEKQLNTELLDIEQHRKASVFAPTGKAIVDARHLTAIVSGTIQKTIAGVKLEPKDGNWRVQFENQNGKLLIKKFEEVKNA